MPIKILLNMTVDMEDRTTIAPLPALEIGCGERELGARELWKVRRLVGRLYLLQVSTLTTAKLHNSLSQLSACNFRAQYTYI
jgi:hypothetical protein